MIYEAIAGLVSYAADCGLIEDCDRVWAINRLLDAVKLSDWQEPEKTEKRPLEAVLGDILDYAVEQGIIDGDITSRDLFDTEIMGRLTPRPGYVRAVFAEKYAESPERPPTGTINSPGTRTISAATASPRM